MIFLDFFDDYSKGDFFEFMISYDDIIMEDTNFIFIPNEQFQSLDAFDFQVQIGLRNNGWYQHCNLQQRKILDEFRKKKLSLVTVSLKVIIN